MDKEKRELVETLSSFPTFAGCDKDDLAALVQAGGSTQLPAGWPFVTQGEPADACYVLLTGAARVYMQRKEIAQLGPGDIIGEMAFLGGGQRGATVTSSERVTALRVENDDLRDIVEKRPHLKETLQRVYASHSGGSDS
jgi:CRP-like cAMP-binding protein